MMNIRKVKEQRKQVIDDKLKRINLKSKRKKTLIKKAIEISQMCQVDILLVMQDREMNKVIEYNSGTKQDGLFTMDSALQAFNDVTEKTKKYQHICDEIYDRYVNGKNRSEIDGDVESQELLKIHPQLKVPKIEKMTMPIV